MAIRRPRGAAVAAAAAAALLPLLLASSAVSSTPAAPAPTPTGGTGPPRSFVVAANGDDSPAPAPAPAPAPPHSFVVAADGDDSAAGDAAHPWRTLRRLANLTLAPGDEIRLRAGDEWDEPLVLGGGDGVGLTGFVDALSCDKEGRCSAHGWAVNCQDGQAHAGARGCLLPSGSPAVPPVRVQLQLDGVEVASANASLSRPDLVKARAAPDPLHGYGLSAQLPAAALHGRHRLAVAVVGCGGCGDGWIIPGSLRCLCDGAICPCTPPDPGTGPPPPPPVRILSTNASAPRPTIRLDGSRTALDDSQWAVRTQGIPWITIEGLSIEHSTSGISVAAGGGGDGAVVVTDCVFRGVWNRSSVGQRLPTTANSCSNGWSPCISTRDVVASVTVSNCLFEDFDVAFQPVATIGKSRFTGNTLTGGNGNVVFFTSSHDWLLSNNVFSRDWAPRYFTCGTTDIMIGGADTVGAISHNEIGWRGEHPAAPDGCAIDYEGESSGVNVTDNFIHDSYGAGVMVFGNKHLAYNISNAHIARNLFVRNGAGQTSSDHGEIALCEPGSTGSIVDNTFFAVDTDPEFVYFETRGPGAVLSSGWTVENNSIHGQGQVKEMIAPTPAVGGIIYDADGAAATVELVPRAPYGRGKLPAIEAFFFTTDNSWPQIGAPTTTVVPTSFEPPNILTNSSIRVTRTAALNVRYRFAEGLLDSMTMTLAVPVPPRPVGY